LQQRQLSELRLSLGESTKDETRALAVNSGIPVFVQEENQESGFGMILNPRGGKFHEFQA